MSRSIERAGDFEYKLKEANNYKIKLQIPKEFTKLNDLEELNISLAAYLDSHFFFVISHDDVLQAYFQKY